MWTGIKDLMIAEITKNDTTTYTTGTPEVLGKIASLKKDYKGDNEALYYDDKLDGFIQSNVGKTFEVEVKELTSLMEAKLQGQKMAKGMRIESTQNMVKDFAVGYRTKDLDGKYEFVWKYVCTPEPFGSDHDTQADKPKVNNRKIKFTCRDREIDGIDGISVNEAELAVGDTEAKELLVVDPTTKKIKWFVSVQEPLSI